MRRKIGKSKNDWPIDSLKVEKDIIATLMYLKALGKKGLVTNHLIKLWKNFERDWNIRPPDFPLEKPGCRSEINS